ncbi:hypothetical protein TKK_0004662 [Trichogramma kaykai]|uniref:CCHC-type domain-containing protein n=1 Tax=Trichogramma kaykai TaxID=54128 RepID=A0ABD2XP79_9HYME
MNTDLDSDSMETDDNNKSKKNRHENKRKFTNDGKDNYSADNKRHNGDTHSSSSDNITPTTGNPSTQEFYKSNAKGPYSVWVRSKTPNKEISQFKVGSLLFKNYSSIQEICRRSRSKVEIYVLSRDQANKLANDQSLIEHGLEAFVPGFRKTRKGIVKYIDVEFSDVELLEGIKCPEFTKVVEVRRINRKERFMSNASNISEEENTQVKWIPTKSVVLSFEDQTLPDYISVWGVRVKVEPYVSKVMQCYKCLKFHHTTKTCRGKQMCFNCGEEQHPNENCKSRTPACANCKADPSINPEDVYHVSISSKCPKVQEQRKINIVMAYDNLSFSQAKALVAPSRTRPNSVNKTQENYPVLMNNNRTMGKTAQPNTSFRPTYINSKNSTPTYKDIVADSASGTSITPASANTSTSDSTSTLTPASPPKTFKTKINNNCTYQAKENNSQSKNSLDLKFRDPTMYLFPQDKNKGLISTTNKLQERLSQGRNDNK